jgi:hypothetical protein
MYILGADLCCLLTVCVWCSNEFGVYLLWCSNAFGVYLVWCSNEFGVYLVCVCGVAMRLACI